MYKFKIFAMLFNIIYPVRTHTNDFYSDLGDKNLLYWQGTLGTARQILCVGFSINYVAFVLYGFISTILSPQMGLNHMFNEAISSISLTYC
jgi:hypothetical protein